MPQVLKPALPRPAPLRTDEIEDELVRRIHWKVGGPSQLSRYEDAGAVRDAVLRALAGEQRSTAARLRVERGDLTALERRVVRTVTNRGAAVRSRTRQRRELARLTAEVASKDRRLEELQKRLDALLPLAAGASPKAAAAAATAAAAPTPAATAVAAAPAHAAKAKAADLATVVKTEDQLPTIADADFAEVAAAAAAAAAAAVVEERVRPPPQPVVPVFATSCAAQSMESLPDFAALPGCLNTSLDFHMFEDLVDPFI